MNIELPSYSDEDLQSYTEQQLIELMIQHEDRVPRNVINECVKREDKMLEALAPMANITEGPKQESLGRWWVRLHAIMILGLIPSEQAGMMMLSFIHYMRQEKDRNLQDWLVGYWPALTHNKPASVIQKLREICEDKEIDWYTRSNISEAIVGNARQQGEQELEKALDWVAGFVEDENEDWDFRLSSGSSLLDFSRDRFRKLLDYMASQQSGFEMYFDKKDVNRAYSQKVDNPEWGRVSDPWSFYQTKAIKERQQRWIQEDRRKENRASCDHKKPDQHFYSGSHQPIQRETPKVGRNDPCPCGSGKKYKKCCLH